MIGPKLRTNIALVGAEEPVTTIQHEQPNVLVDPSKLFDHVSEEYRKTDIEEDEDDKFITTRSGKPRAQLIDGSDDWADDSLIGANPIGRALIRKKRCGGGGGDDGDANRSRRARRTRSNRRARRTQKKQVRRQKKAARKAARTRTTTITRTILPANQVATTYQGQSVISAQTGAQVRVQPIAPAVVHQQTIAPATVQQQHIASAEVHQQTLAPAAVVQTIQTPLQ